MCSLIRSASNNEPQKRKPRQQRPLHGYRLCPGDLTGWNGEHDTLNMKHENSEI
jgi:hypothetical protein